ncbi:glutamine--fructose-6-phosphate transaminase (isomerizing) (plasmid) [Chitinibacter bivalviorum]|uniref:Glutamine--fructose-6-phosphate aminotransferase [isomerizing] n=1 Tax=Chitinibacter bivalviorum TaxID=2739434 RepID=A0A7H9BS78_9NEIS|nr:glutamine--fructose-6-phosphate transaminase (isomerizing) [Chitinibacter bivalviorum]QLG88235.1 glutamine--fructose-6-phosphate transaminase (isomerizing) [Chitinibacter bivalviorum]QLG90084.1 glutamine--fructose-6-phosphate transaminase (isomerizing) [Chitinibacter bivalviorum]
MCGIVGAVSTRNVVPMLIEGLSRLEYRGYDSSGIALVLNQANSPEFERVRVAGRVADLNAKTTNSTGQIGIAHTRWATHGAPNEANAHPHLGGNEIMVVHNGIIENFADIKNELIALGYTFTSETDTEVIAHLIAYQQTQTPTFLAAVQASIRQLHGAFAIGVLSLQNPTQVICARQGSPLVIGLGFQEFFFASDIAALLPLTQKMIYLEEGDIALLDYQKIQIWDNTGLAVIRQPRMLDVCADSAELGPYRHYMQKEIFEQPTAIANTINQALSQGFNPDQFGEQAQQILQQATAIRIIACGTSYHAGLVARYWIEAYTGMPVSVDIASEYRYSNGLEQRGTLIIAISQSGETADLLAAIRNAKERGEVKILALCNVAHSTLTREADLSILTQAGIEIGVASTKAFTTQLAALYVFAGCLAQARSSLSDEKLAELANWLPRLPAMISAALSQESEIEGWAQALSHHAHTLYLGRNTLFPIALEGALKLKEIAYIHAEGYAAGELKHGPLALVDENMPVIVCAANDALFEKLMSNLREVEARGGQIYLIAEPGCEAALPYVKSAIFLPLNTGPLAPIVFTIPLQLLAYHTAHRKGTDVDKPRNLAKSVTVE